MKRWHSWVVLVGPLCDSVLWLDGHLMIARLSLMSYLMPSLPVKEDKRHLQWNSSLLSMTETSIVVYHNSTGSGL